MSPEEQFLMSVVQQMVAYPSEVKIKRSVDDMGVLLSLSVNQADMGIVIGKEGGTAKALRTILRVVGMRSNARVTMKILEPAIRYGAVA